MQELTFVGVSEDGSRLTLALPDGRRFALPIDERLRAATRGGGRTGQLAMSTEEMRPRDVQARLRAGASVDEVAEQSGWPLARVEAFAVPIHQERSFVAERARTSMIRDAEGEASLEEVVSHRLAERGVDAEDLRWDSWRTEDDRWTVMLAYPAGRGDQVATWTFDMESRTLAPVDDEARWLSEYRAEQGEAEQPPVSAEPDEPGAQIVNLPPAKDRAAEESGSKHPALRRQSAEEGRTPDSARTAGADRPAERNRGGKTSGSGEGKDKRASVPSWDEILFGGPGGPENP